MRLMFAVMIYFAGILDFALATGAVYFGFSYPISIPYAGLGWAIATGITYKLLIDSPQEKKSGK